jgi:hypothetical protein
MADGRAWIFESIETNPVDSSTVATKSNSPPPHKEIKSHEQLTPLTSQNQLYNLTL